MRRNNGPEVMFAAAIHSFTATIGQAVAPGMTAIFSARVRLYSRPGNDLTDRFPLIVEALARLRPRSCIVDGEAVSCGDDGGGSGRSP